MTCAHPRNHIKDIGTTDITIYNHHRCVTVLKSLNYPKISNIDNIDGEIIDDLSAKRRDDVIFGH